MRTRTILMLALAGSLASGVAQGDGAPGPGLRVHVDPNTGEIIEPPASGPRVADVPADSDTDDLLEEPVSSPAGGTKIDLRGRFRSTTRVTVGQDGAITKDCVVAEGTER